MATPHRFGSVRELPSGNFQARYRPRNGDHRKAMFETLHDAEAWLQELEAELEAQSPELEAFTTAKARRMAAKS